MILSTINRHGNLSRMFRVDRYSGKGSVNRIGCEKGKQ